MARILVVNSGSSSLKYRVLESDSGSQERLLPLAMGLIERIGSPTSHLSLRVEGRREQSAEEPVKDAAAAANRMCAGLAAGGLLSSIDTVGHRLVHGGSHFIEAAVVDDSVEQRIADLTPLAPLHNPPALAAIRATRAALPSVPQVAVFDTAFHSTLPPLAYTYAIPRALAQQHGIRRYGFHGTSVRYVVRTAAALLDVPVNEASFIVCHIGNGASITAVERGRSIDTSMGLTPLEGLVMGTRSGDIDPAVTTYLHRVAGLDGGEVEHLLEFESGLLGLCGDSDVREVRRRAAEGDDGARLALDVYAYRLRKYIGAYLAVLPSLNAVVFTGGVGEHDADLRAEVIDPLAQLGLRLHAATNAAAVQPTSAVRISTGDGPAVLVIPTDEEAEIAFQVLQTLGK